MKSCVILLHLVIPLASFGQPENFLDPRDGRNYRTAVIGSTLWMLDNLQFVTKNSVGVTPEQAEKFKKFNLKGRYYHFLEIDSVCPNGWRVPDVPDWTAYFQLLVKDHPDVKLEIITDIKENHLVSFMNYNEKIDLFAAGNPLNLSPTGRTEGSRFQVPDVYADYFTRDIKETYPGKSHIHIMNAWTTIHSHKHNMEPDKESELRKFMVRCVKTVADGN